MAPLNEAQLHQIRDDRKEQIIRAALKVFSRRGIAGTKMSMIATEAGISQGLFYNYFKSKDELFISLVQEAVESSRASFAELYQAPGSALDRIRLLTESMIQADGSLYFKLIHQAQSSDGVPEKAKQLIEQYSLKMYVDQLLPLFTEGQQAGDIAEGNLEELISSYLTVLSGVMVLSTQEGGGYRIPNADILMRMVTGPGL